MPYLTFSQQIGTRNTDPFCIRYHLLPGVEVVVENVAEIELSKKMATYFLGHRLQRSPCSCTKVAVLPWHRTEEMFPDLASTAKIPQISAKIVNMCASQFCAILLRRKLERALTEVNLTSWSAVDGEGSM